MNDFTTMLDPHGRPGSCILLSFLIQMKPLGPREANSLAQGHTAKDTTKIRQKPSHGEGQPPPQLPFHTGWGVVSHPPQTGLCSGSCLAVARNLSLLGDNRFALLEKMQKIRPQLPKVSPEKGLMMLYGIPPFPARNPRKEEPRTGTAVHPVYEEMTPRSSKGRWEE